MRPFARLITATAVLALGATTLSGCATTDFVRKEIAGVTGRVDGTQDQLKSHDAKLNAHDSKIGEIDRTSREALERATAAGKLAEGKFLYTVVLSDDSVKFPVASSALSEEAKTRLNDFVQKLKTDNKNVYLEIQGHSDNTGAKAVNQRLGEERADAVRLFLNQQGVALNRMSTISYGDSSPVASNKTRAGRAQNRRVVVVVLN